MWKMLSQIAFLNLTRNYRRTFITLFAVANAICGGLLFYGFANETYWGLREVFARGGLGHIQIAKKDWFTSPSPENERVSLSELDDIRKEILESEKINKNIQAITVRRQINGIISTGEKSDVFVGTGTEPNQELLVSPLISVIDGKKLGEDDPYTSVIGYKLAQRISASPGITVSLLVGSDTKMTNAIDTTLTGISKTGSDEFDRVSLSIPLKTALELADSDKVDNLVISLIDSSKTNEVLKDVRTILEKDSFKTLNALSVEELANYYKSVKNLYDRIFGFVELLLFLFSVLAVSNTILMSVTERKQEIGMLLSLGSRKNVITKLFLLEGLFIGILGSLLGVALAFLITYAVKIFGGLPMPPPPGFSLGYNIFFRIDIIGILLVMPVGVISAMVAAVSPAARVARQNIALLLSGAAAFLFIFLINTTKGFSSDITPSLSSQDEKIANEILTKLDKARGAENFQNFVTDVSFVDLSNTSNKVSYRVAISGEKSLAVTTSREKGKREALLSIVNDLWFQTEKMKLPMKISPTQRLLGPASNGDLLTVRLKDNYVPSVLIKESPISVEMTPRAGKESVYGKIILICVSSKDNTCPKVEKGLFYTKSGKLLKTLYYEYSGNNLESLIIEDGIQKKSRIKILFDDIDERKFEKDFFEVDNLLRSALKLL